MLDRMSFAAFRAYNNAKRKMNELSNNENGMETLETVILVAVAVVIAVLIVQILTKKSFGSSNGLVGYIFDTFKAKIDDIFGATSLGS